MYRLLYRARHRKTREVIHGEMRCAVDVAKLLGAPDASEPIQLTEADTIWFNAIQNMLVDYAEDHGLSDDWELPYIYGCTEISPQDDDD